MKWIAKKLQEISDFFQGKAEWLDDQNAAANKRFAAYTSRVLKTIVAAFFAGVAVGALIFR